MILPHSCRMLRPKRKFPCVSLELRSRMRT